MHLLRFIGALVFLAAGSLELSEAARSRSGCFEGIDRLELVLLERIKVLTLECGVAENHVIEAGDGSLTVSDEGMNRLHSPKCKEVYECKSLPDVDDVVKQCGYDVIDVKMQTIVDDILNFNRVVAVLHDGRCSDPDRTILEEEEGLCPDRAMVSHNCGHLGITQDECEQKGCCWDPDHQLHRNWCYHSRSQKMCEQRCPDEYFDRQQRVECTPFLLLERFTHHDPAVRGDACMAMGCCWQELEHNSREPWCFHTPCL